jgi:hypothetical protein
MHTLRRLFAADRWPWTWSVFLLAWGLIQPHAWIAAVEIADRARRDRWQLAGCASIATGAAHLVGVGWHLVLLAAALAVIAWRVGDRTPGAQRAPRIDRRAARRADRDARHDAADAAEAWR